MMKSKQIQIYDTTLRDGSQSEEISFTVEDKLRIAEKLDFLGIHYIEAGWPGASPKDSEFFSRAVKELKLKNSRLVAFGSTRRAGVSAAGDRTLADLLKAGTKTICIFGKTWDMHVKKALGIPLEENFGIIRDSVEFLKKNRREVIFDAEHFFDGYKTNARYALKSLQAAREGGADRLVLCDTNGGTLPEEIFKIVSAVRKKIEAPLGIHCHNDADTAVANSLAAVRAGATQVQGTINGIGERCGNANLCSVVANLELKMGYRAVGGKRLSHLQEVAVFVDEMANRGVNHHQPYVGRAAFAHKGGVHVHAILKDSKTYEHIDPKAVGNIQRILISDLSGATAVAHKAREFGVNLEASNPKTRELLAQLKEMENRGYQFEGAEASFEIFIKKGLGKYKPHFVLHDFKVTDNIRGASVAPSNRQSRIGASPSTPSGLGASVRHSTSQAVMHLAVEGHEETAEAEGVGPVHALDQALRKALQRFYPVIAEVNLLDYKVRVLPAGGGTAASVRVLIECGDGKSKWSTVGVSENIIHASYQALVDSIDYKLMKGHL